jgi:hypothetical protein
MRPAAAAAAALALAGCVSLRPVHDGPVTITRSLSLGIYRSCLSAGAGLMLCEHIRFDPGVCAMVVIYPRAPSLGERSALAKLGAATRAVCLATKDPKP